MELLSCDGANAELCVSISELGMINAALNEVVNGVRELGDDDEFETRITGTRAAARTLLREVYNVLQLRSPDRNDDGSR